MPTPNSEHYDPIPPPRSEFLRFVLLLAREIRHAVVAVATFCVLFALTLVVHYL